MESFRRWRPQSSGESHSTFNLIYDYRPTVLPPQRGTDELQCGVTFLSITLGFAPLYSCLGTVLRRYGCYHLPSADKVRKIGIVLPFRCLTSAPVHSCFDQVLEEDDKVNRLVRFLNPLI